MTRKLRLLILILLAKPTLSASNPFHGTDFPGWSSLKWSREQKIKKCAECHTREWRNWSKGPHANALQKLNDYQREVAQNKVYPDEERAVVKQPYCLKCHISQNIFEDYLPIDKTDFDFKNGIAARLESPKSAVDCLTCHMSGDRVITREDYKPSRQLPKSPFFCNPQPSKVFSSSTSCLVCHIDIKDQIFSYEKSHGAEVKNCTQCHMEKSGSGIHYTYWAHDSAKDFSQRPSQLKPFDKFEIHVIRLNGILYLDVKWKNDFAPHSIIPSGPRQDVIKIEVFDRENHVTFRHFIRFTSQDFFLRASSGQNAEKVTLKHSSTYHQKLKLTKESQSNGRIKLTVGRKTSFFLDDDKARPIFEKEFPFEIEQK